MKKKKDPARFTIGFNPSLLNHQKAIKILLSIPERAKAQTIADALVLYNKTFGMVDDSSLDDVLQLLSEAEDYKANSKTVSQKKKDKDLSSNEPVEDNSLILDDYDYDDEFIDDDEDNSESNSDGSEYNDIFAQSLMSMGFSKKSESED